MQRNYKYSIKNPNFDSLGHIVAVANLKDKHDRSAPSDYHWKILKCRMIIFSNSSILASPDKNDVKQIHIIFNKVGADFDKLNSLFLKFSLQQEGAIRQVNPDIYTVCFQYTMTAKLAPLWNTLGQEYLINNRDFLTSRHPQNGIKYCISSRDDFIELEVKPVNIHILRSDETFQSGEWIRVLPSLLKATLDDNYADLPETGNFKSYKDLRRHWKNIHGYRLPEEEGSYCTVQFWRGEPLTYPKICVIRNFPIITPLPKSEQNKVLANFISCLKSKMPHFLGKALSITLQNHDNNEDGSSTTTVVQSINDRLNDTQAVSLCTPTQYIQ